MHHQSNHKNANICVISTSVPQYTYHWSVPIPEKRYAKVSCFVCTVVRGPKAPNVIGELLVLINNLTRAAKCVASGKFATSLRDCDCALRARRQILGGQPRGEIVAKQHATITDVPRCTQNILPDVALAPLTETLPLRYSQTTRRPPFAAAAVKHPIACCSRFYSLSAPPYCARSRGVAVALLLRCVPSTFGDKNEPSLIHKKALPCNTNNVFWAAPKSGLPLEAKPSNWRLVPGGLFLLLFAGESERDDPW